MKSKLTFNYGNKSLWQSADRGRFFLEKEQPRKKTNQTGNFISGLLLVILLCDMTILCTVSSLINLTVLPTLTFHHQITAYTAELLSSANGSRAEVIRRKDKRAAIVEAIIPNSSNNDFLQTFTRKRFHFQ